MTSPPSAFHPGRRARRDRRAPGLAAGLILAASLGLPGIVNGVNPPPVERRDVPDVSGGEEWGDATGWALRRVGLNGFPLPDQQAEDKPETDEADERSYIDAFSLSLRHDTSDVYVPIPGKGSLALAVKRSNRTEIWNSDPASPNPASLPVRPFGPCWSSGIASYLAIVYTPSESYAEVYDENDTV